MILRYLTTVLVLMFLAGIATAGLDGDGRFDRVVAVYQFEDATDSGPREFDGVLLEDASIVDGGKIDKCLQLEEEDWFGTLDDLFLGIVNSEFSIVAWVKLPTQAYAFNITAAGTNDDDTSAGAIQLSIETSGNIKGSHIDFEDVKLEEIESDDENVSDNTWHHIAYTKYADTYTLFIDGEVVKKERKTNYLGFVSDSTLIAIRGKSDEDLTGTVLVDEVGFFETGFSVYEIEGLYDDGLTDFLEAMPVDPRAKVATTWGAIKRDRW